MENLIELSKNEQSRIEGGCRYCRAAGAAIRQLADRLVQLNGKVFFKNE